RLVKGIAHTNAISLDANDPKALDEQVAKHDLVVSLIPYLHHTTIIKSAIRQKKHVVTTSYISPAMAELDEEAKKAKITVMNEIGLDPGIDHLYAVKMIDEVHQAGGKILSFLSYCGGLPAPEASGNPLGVKFSWSPRGFLMTAMNDAKFWKDGKIQETAGKELMRAAEEYDVLLPAFAFYAYPNRDSSGYTALMKTIVAMGFVGQEKRDFLEQHISWREATQKLIGASSSSREDIEHKISTLVQFGSEKEREQIMKGLHWVGVFSDEKIKPAGTPIDVLCASLETKMAYGEGERDMVILQHKFEVLLKDGSKETRTSTLCDFGKPNGYSSMARLVGTPCAIAVKQVLDGTISDRGILAPLTPKLNDPLMAELRKYGISLKEEVLL
ncbi:hypothetical protein MMC10_006847, partial [Thelotrema lepadinum]|nr:hypothetical protein [Thelotrema lepadinum]